MESWESGFQNQAGDSSDSQFRLALRPPDEIRSRSIQFPRLEELSDDEDDDAWISIGIDLGTT